MSRLGDRRTDNGRKIMSRPPQKKKQVREEKTTEQTLIQAAIHSQYNTCTPMVGAAYIRIKHPVTRLDIHCSTNSNKFFELFKELCDKGMADRLFTELTSFGSDIDEKWFEVLGNARAYCERQKAEQPA
jgi:hypothetical protein